MEENNQINVVKDNEVINHDVALKHKGKINDWVNGLGLGIGIDNYDHLTLIGKVLIYSDSTNPLEVVSGNAYDSSNEVLTRLKSLINNSEKCPRRKEILESILFTITDLYKEGEWAKLAEEFTQSEVKAKINGWISDLENVLSDWEGKDAGDYDEARDIYNGADEVNGSAETYKGEIESVMEKIDMIEVDVVFSANQQALVHNTDFYQVAIDRLDVLISDSEDVREKADEVSRKGDELENVVSELHDVTIDTDEME